MHVISTVDKIKNQKSGKDFLTRTAISNNTMKNPSGEPIMYLKNIG